MARSLYLEKLHNVEHDIYVVLKEIFSYVSLSLKPILKGMCLIMASFGGLIITGWLMFLLLLPLLFVVAIIWSLLVS